MRLGGPAAGMTSPGVGVGTGVDVKVGVAEGVGVAVGEPSEGKILRSLIQT